MIHPTAIIDPSAEIAEGVEIGPYSVIGKDVSIGSGTRVRSHVVIQGPTKIGKENDFFQFSSIGEDPQDLKFKGETSYLEIGDRNIFRESSTVNRGTEGGGGITKMGDDNLVMAYAHVAHDCIIGNHVVLVNNATLAGHVTIEDYAILGGFTGVSQFLTIGAHAFTTAGSMVNKNIPPYVLVSGSFARPVNLNMVGLKRRGFSSEQVQVLKQAYKLLFQGHQPLDEVMQQLKELAQDQDVVTPMIQFIEKHKSSKAGVIR